MTVKMILSRRPVHRSSCMPSEVEVGVNIETEKSCKKIAGNPADNAIGPNIIR